MNLRLLVIMIFLDCSRRVKEWSEKSFISWKLIKYSMLSNNFSSCRCVAFLCRLVFCHSPRNWKCCLLRASFLPPSLLARFVCCCFAAFVAIKERRNILLTSPRCLNAALIFFSKIFPNQITVCLGYYYCTLLYRYLHLNQVHRYKIKKAIQHNWWRNHTVILALRQKAEVRSLPITSRFTIDDWEETPPAKSGTTFFWSSLSLTTTL